MIRTKDPTDTRPSFRRMQRLFRRLAYLIGTKRGLYRIAKCLAMVFPAMRRYRAVLVDGSDIVLDLRETMCFSLFMEGRIPHERSLCRIFKRLVRQGDIFVDVGANVGFYTAVARKWVGPSGRVIAFEPNIKCVNLMKLSFAPNANVTIVPKAAGKASCREKLYVPIRGDRASIGLEHEKAK